MSLTKCPYFAEEIQADAIKCKHCNSWLTGDPTHGTAGVHHDSAIPTPIPRLIRSSTDKMIAGICGGMAIYLGIDSTILRILIATIVVFTGFVPGIIAYICMWFIIPRDETLII